jgi:hypothetical protein
MSNNERRLSLNNKLKIGIGTEAFPPTIDGISTVAKCYADILTKFTDTKVFSRLAKATLLDGLSKNNLQQM